MNFEARIVMATVLWDSKEVLLLDHDHSCTLFWGEDTTQKGDPKQTRGKLTKMCFYSTKMLVQTLFFRPKTFLRSFDGMFSDIYFPDHAPNFHLLPQLKQHLNGRRFTNKEDLKEEKMANKNGSRVVCMMLEWNNFYLGIKKIWKLRRLCRKLNFVCRFNSK